MKTKQDLIIEVLNKHSVKAAPAGSVIFNCDFKDIASEIYALESQEEVKPTEGEK